MKSNNPLYTVLSFDRFIEKRLTLFERMLIHQNINQKKPLGHELCFKIIQIQMKINALKWRAPEYRYNQDRMIEIFNQDKTIWEVLK